MRKILFVSGTRAEYGLMKPILDAIFAHPNLELEIIATGMHLMDDFGYSISEIKKDGFKVHEINATYKKDEKESVVEFINKFVKELNIKIKEINPNIILVNGDRPEALCGALVGAYLSIPVAHSHGGEVTSTVDEIARHTITKLAHIHFPATSKSAKRIIRMGENPNNVFTVGAPGVTRILNSKLLTKEEISKKLNLDHKREIILVLQHPVTLSYNLAGTEMKETLDAISELDLQAAVIYPNADPGGRRMIKVIENYPKKNIHSFKNLDHDLFLSLLKNSDVMVGNSSSGIIETPSFKLPVVNIGERQIKRERTKNVIDVAPKKEEIIKGIRKALSNDFKLRLENLVNPYDKGDTGKNVTEILSSIKIDDNLIQKRIGY